MHSFHPSRGRIVFEVLCALTVSASCAGAWVQTGASAFLPAAFAAALYGLWHLTDMTRPRGTALAVATGDARVADGQGDLVDYLAAAEPPPAAEPQAVPVEAEPVAAEEPKPAPVKRRARKKKPVAEAPDAPLAAAAEAPVPEVPAVAHGEEEHHAPIAPLFEPQPLVRQPRPVFGRKSGLPGDTVSRLG